MKKYLCLLLLLIVPFSVKAVSRVDYSVENLYVDAQIESDGDLHVRELIVLYGSFNGYVRDITYRNSMLRKNEPIDFSSDAIYNGTGIENVSLKAKKITEQATFEMMDDTDFIPLRKTSYLEDAQNKEYVESSLQDGKSYKMYFETIEGTSAFLLDYTIKNVVVKHEDVGELYWNFVGDGFDDNINYVEIRVHLPKKDGGNLFRVWAHGDLTGNIDPVDSEYALATIKSLKSNHAVDIRMTFDKTLVPYVIESKTTMEEALPQIIEVESERARVANEERERAQNAVNLVTVICAFYIVIIIICWIIVYFLFDREYKSDFNLQYNREFIDRYNVEVVDVLMKNTVTPNALSASILNLIYKKNIEANDITLANSKKKDYEFILKTRDNLNDTEEVLVNFLFGQVGKGDRFTTRDLKRYASAVATYQYFNTSYTNWVGCVKKDAEKQNFYEHNGQPVITGVFFLVIAILITFYSTYHVTGLVIPYVVLFLGIFYFIYSLALKKRTKEGNEDYVRWKAFKRFLEDFGSFETKELPEIHLWERYLVYATVFGIADQVEKSMNVKIQEMQVTTNSTYTPSWIDYHIAHDISDSISDSFNAYHSTYNAQVASSRSSSGGGFGGGFSSGGGGGGGGGGGHGF